jgi:hypothetical protein
MKYLVCFLVLLSTLRLDAVLTVTARGGAQNQTSQTTLVVNPTTTLQAGTLGVMLYAFDNAGTAGSFKIFTNTTFNDSVGNTWTLQLDAIYDPGAVAAGVEIAAYTAPIVTSVTSADNITVTVFTATTGKTARLWEVSGSGGVPTFVAVAAISDLLTSGQTGTAVSITTSSIPSGDAIIAWSGAEGNLDPSAIDSDTTNGSWSGNQKQALGTPMRIDSQSKVVTGAGTQTYDITYQASYDWECAWIQFTEASAASKTNGFF